LEGSVPVSLLKFCPLSPLILKSSWIISVELAIGPEEGISYLTDKGANVSPLLFPFLSCCLNKHDLLWTELYTKGSDKSNLWVKHRRARKFSIYSCYSDTNSWFRVEENAVGLSRETASALALNWLAFVLSEVLACRTWSISGDFL